jgi:hypothetical protein
MFDEADAFIALPGGFGTLEELLEMVREGSRKGGEREREREREREKKRKHNERRQKKFTQKKNSSSARHHSFQITWSQLGFHKKPVGILNCEGFYDKLLAFFDDAVTLGFVAEASRAIVVDAGDAPGLLDALEAHRPPPPVVPPSELPPAVALDVDVLN